MAKIIKGHTVAALVVLVATAAWVGTGEFSSVGSKIALAAQRPGPRGRRERYGCRARSNERA